MMPDTFEEWADSREPGIGIPPVPNPLPEPKEVEPVAVRDNGGKNGIRWLSVDFPEEGLLLYTHAAPSDELVKAAEEVINCFYNSGYDGALEELIINLRAALDKVKP